jgi:hypothetical protein
MTISNLIALVLNRKHLVFRRIGVVRLLCAFGLSFRLASLRDPAARIHAAFSLLGTTWRSFPRAVHRDVAGYSAIS